MAETDTLCLLIQDNAHVARGAAILRGEEALPKGVKTLQFAYTHTDIDSGGAYYRGIASWVYDDYDDYDYDYLEAKEAIGDKGDSAVVHTLADAVRVSRLGLHVRFAFCNLSEGACSHLASALVDNRSLTGFSCFGHLGEWSKDVAAFENAVVQSEAPLVIWNNGPLDDRIVTARKNRVKRAVAKAPLVEARSMTATASSEVSRAGLTTPSRAPPSHDYVLFFSYAQMDASTETALFYYKAIDRGIPREQVFHDSNSKFKLTELVARVQRSRNVVVLLTPNYCKRPFTLVELHFALKSGANVIPVKLVKPGTPQFDFGQVQSDIKSGEIRRYLSEDAWAILNEHDVSIEDVMKDLSNVMDHKAISFQTDHSMNIQDAIFNEIFDGLLR